MRRTVPGWTLAARAMLSVRAVCTELDPRAVASTPSKTIPTRTVTADAGLEVREETAVTAAPLCDGLEWSEEENEGTLTTDDGRAVANSVPGLPTIDEDELLDGVNDGSTEVAGVDGTEPALPDVGAPFMLVLGDADSDGDAVPDLEPPVAEDVDTPETVPVADAVPVADEDTDASEVATPLAVDDAETIDVRLALAVALELVLAVAVPDAEKLGPDEAVVVKDVVDVVVPLAVAETVALAVAVAVTLTVAIALALDEALPDALIVGVPLTVTLAIAVALAVAVGDTVAPAPTAPLPPPLEPTIAATSVTFSALPYTRTSATAPMNGSVEEPGKEFPMDTAPPPAVRNDAGEVATRVPFKNSLAV
jgi:hypothetical protein